MSAPLDPSILLIPVALTSLLDQAEAQHGAAMQAGEFHRAEQWVKIRDALVDLIFESGAAR